MRYFAECIGWLAIVLWTLGALGALDFHVCIDKAGACQITKKDPQ